MKKLLDWLEGTCTIERGLIVAFVLMWSVFSVLTFKLMEESYIGFGATCCVLKRYAA